MAFERAERLDAMTAREKDGKTYWSRLGVAFPAKQGPGWNIYLDSIPASVDGQYKIMLMAPKPKGDTGGGSSGGPAGGDDIPFAPW
jgi:hypothetical protein